MVNAPAVAVLTATRKPLGAFTDDGPDATNDLAWTISTSGDRAPASFRVLRNRRSDGTQVVAAELAGSVRKWTDTASDRDDALSWQVVAVNAAGSTPSNTTPWFHGTPRPATPPTVVRLSETQAVVSWTPRARYATAQDLEAEWSTDGWDWTDYVVPSGSGLAPSLSSLTATIPLAPTRRWRFWVQSRLVPGSTTAWLYAYSDVSPVVWPTAKPAAPTPTSPAGVVSSAVVPVFGWRFAAADASLQSQAEVRYRLLVTDPWTVLSVSGVASTVAAATTLDAGSYTWQVRARGVHPDWSDWSPERTMIVGNPPTVTITTPAAGSLASNRLTVGISYAESGGAAMTGWTRRLRSGGVVLEEVSGSGAQSSLTFSTVLSDATAYTAEVEVVSGLGLRSVAASRSWTTAFLRPGAPALTLTWLETQGVMQATATNPGASSGVAATTDNRLERLVVGSWVSVAEGLGVNPTAQDWQVPLGVDSSYRMVAISALGVERPSVTVVAGAPTGRVWLSLDASRAIALAGGVSLDPQWGHDLVLEDYFGRSLPTPHYGEGRPMSVGVTGTLVKGRDLEQDFGALRGRTFWYRDPAGRSFLATLAADGYGLPQSWHGLGKVDFRVVAVDG